MAPVREEGRHGCGQNGENLSKGSSLSWCPQIATKWEAGPHLPNFPEKMGSPDLCTDLPISATNQKILYILCRRGGKHLLTGSGPWVSFV